MVLRYHVKTPPPHRDLLPTNGRGRPNRTGRRKGGEGGERAEGARGRHQTTDQTTGIDGNRHTSTIKANRCDPRSTLPKGTQIAHRGGCTSGGRGDHNDHGGDRGDRDDRGGS